MATFSPYLHFQGNAAEAFNTYKEVFGGEFEILMKYTESPVQDQHATSNPDWIMHVTLKTPMGLTIQGSDRPEAFGPVNRGDAFFVNVMVDSADEARKIYEGLSKDGNVFMPLEKTFWAELYGMFADKYGVQWMINYNG